MTMKQKNEVAVITNQNKSIQVKDAAWNSLAEESKKAYHSDYKLFFDFVKKDQKEITASDVLSFIEHLEKNNYKNNSINRKVASISKMFKVMVIAGEIKQNPVDVLKQFKNISHKTSKTINIGLTLDDIKKTVKVTKYSTDQQRKISLIIRMLAMSGLRISEFTGIKNNDIADFDSDNKIITIVGKGNKERKIYITNSFLQEIRTVYPMKKEIPYLFYNIRNQRYDRRVLWLQLKQTFKDKVNKNMHPHELRHFFATNALKQGEDIKSVSLYLGHSDVSVSLNFYIDTAMDIKAVNKTKI
jgi:integrase/recombinase XerD